VPVKAPHYHLMGGRARHADPATARQALLRLSQPNAALLRLSQPNAALLRLEQPNAALLRLEQLGDERTLSARPDAIGSTVHAEEAR
jgi:hypothetical protein